MTLFLQCDKCKAVYYEWSVGGGVERCADSDMWRSHICFKCSRIMQRIGLEMEKIMEKRSGEDRIFYKRKEEELFEKYRRD